MAVSIILYEMMREPRAPALKIGQGRVGLLASIKAEAKSILSTRVDTDLNEAVLAFEKHHFEFAKLEF